MLRGLTYVKLLLCAWTDISTHLHYSTHSILKETSSPCHTGHGEVEWLAEGHIANKWQHQEGLDSSSGLRTFTALKTMPATCLEVH